MTPNFGAKVTTRTFELKIDKQELSLNIFIITGNFSNFEFRVWLLLLLFILRMALISTSSFHTPSINTMILHCPGHL